MKGYNSLSLISHIFLQDAWAAAIMLHFNQSYILLCSGTILSEQFILTAAHCKRQAQILLKTANEDILKANLTIVMGVPDPTKSDRVIKRRKGIKRKIASFEIHPAYKGNAYYDAGLLKLESKIIFTKVKFMNRE